MLLMVVSRMANGIRVLANIALLTLTLTLGVWASIGGLPPRDLGPEQHARRRGVGRLDLCKCSATARAS